MLRATSRAGRSFFDHLGEVDLDALGRALSEIAGTTPAHGAPRP